MSAAMSPGRGRNVAVLAVGSLMVFIPFATANNVERATQTMTLLALVLAVSVAAIVWLMLERRKAATVERKEVPAAFLGLAALAGSLLALPFVASLAGATETPPGLLEWRLLGVSAFYAGGIWLFVVGVRGLFPAGARAIAAGAIAMLFFGLAPAPLLLVQPGTVALRVADVALQLRAGFLYWTVGAALLVAPLLALTTLPGDWFERWWTRAADRVMAIPDRVFALGLVIVTLTITLGFTFYSFDARPTTADEIAQLWHARILLTGRLSLPADPNPEFFAIDNVIDHPQWMSQFPIGGPGLLAIGIAAGAVWLLNPVLTAFTALNVYRFSGRAFGEPQARAAAVLFLASPMMLIMGATQMNHMPTAWLVTSALAALPVWIASTEPTRWRNAAIVIGAALGAALTVRPLDAVVAGVVLGLTMLAVCVKPGGRARAPSVLIALGVATLPATLLLLANWRMHGHPVRFGYEMLWGANHSLGLHDDPLGQPHTAWRALLLGTKYLTQLNWFATAWPIPLLAIVAAGLMLTRRARRWDILLLALSAAQLVVYAFYWHDGQFVGPRFLFTVVPAVLILAARMPFVASERLNGVSRRVAFAIIPACIGVAWLWSMPPFGVQGITREFRETRARLKLDPPREVTTGETRNALIFVQEGASARLLRRLWGLGISRPNAARLLAASDACSLFDAVRSEEAAGATDSVTRLFRIRQRVRPFRPAPANLQTPDVNLRITDSTSLTSACSAEILHDAQVSNSIAYGPMLLLNEIDDDGRIDGAAVYVIDLRERNEVLRARFGDRRWYRYEVPRGRLDSLPVLVPYESAR